MKKTIVINVVGLTNRLIGQYTPFIKKFSEQGRATLIKPLLPAVTCSVQSTYLTGKWPAEHGIVGNGWYFKDECEVKFWRQSNKLVEAEKIWDRLKKKDAGFTVANLFWWYNMYSNADFSVTPRPNYLADGRKIPDIYSEPSTLRDHLQEKLGTFPLFNFWGPKTSIKSSQWIADASIETDKIHDPTLTLVYLPHLDYNLQRHGIDFENIAQDLKEIDRVVEQLVSHYQEQDCHIILLSEYGITNVKKPVHLNRILRANGYIAIRKERGLELLDAGASRAFSVADHQVAHVYLNDKTLKNEVRKLLEDVDGVQQVMDEEALTDTRLKHERAGDLVVVADKNSWFTYYFWADDAKAPDYARMVDIHKKPGYDPVEMFTDPSDKFVMLKVIRKLIRKKLGFRTIMDIIPLKAELVKGSHGRIPEETDDYPVFISTARNSVPLKPVSAVEVCGLIEKHVLSDNTTD